LAKKKKDTEETIKEVEILEPEDSGVEVEGKEQCPVCPELDDRLKRLGAEYDNYRKRTAKERLELVPEITAKNAAEFLPVLDNIERALEAECTDPAFRKGIEMIYESFVQTLVNLGVEEITEEDFNPSVHQAIQQIEHDELESGKVAQVFQKGYRIGERIIRFAMVAIVK
jgi:molecular chaperone GrpE